VGLVRRSGSPEGVSFERTPFVPGPFLLLGFLLPGCHEVIILHHCAHHREVLCNDGPEIMELPTRD
jgi:hypothetical protein